MKTLLLICVLYLTAKVNVADPKPEGPHHHPIYRYSCNEDMSATFKGVNGNVVYFIPSPTPFPTPTPNSCVIMEIQHHSGTFNIPPVCFNSANKSTERIVYVLVSDKNENEPRSTRPTPTALPDKFAVSGGHIFKLTCLPIPNDGVMRYALAETGVKDFEEMHEVYNEVKDVDMRFKEGADINLPDVSEVYIGDMFYMYIKYMGTQIYKIIPLKCSAHKGTFRLTDSTDTLNLFDKSIGSHDCLTQVASDYKIMNAFKRLDARTVYAQLYGFRIADKLTGDANGDDITISCTVTICSGCGDICGIPAPPPRKRRSADASVSVHTVHKTIKIKDKDLNSNDAGTQHGCRTVVTVALLALVIRMIL